MKKHLYYPELPCWIPNPQKGWVAGTVTSCECSDGKAVVTVEDEEGIITTYDVKEDDLMKEGSGNLPLLRNTKTPLDADDLTSLPILNEPSVLETLLNRYGQMKIYTYSGIVLIAVNPFQHMSSLYAHEMVRAYYEKSRDELDPHLYAIAAESYRCMNRDEKNQTIIISGESGAGKTVSARFIMRYFASIHNASDAGSAEEFTAIENEILATNPIMEAFGNAKTSRNDNSSRFGKYIQILFNGNSRIIGARIQTYLLERSRLTFQPATERNYHIFYQLLSGASNELLGSLNLASDPSMYHYMNQGGASNIDGVNDKEEFETTVTALKTVGVSDETCSSIYSVLAALLHIGNIEVTASRNDAYVNAKEDSLKMASKLLEIDASKFAKWITHRNLKMRNDSIVKPLTKANAIIARDSVSKYLYACLFDWLVATINESLTSSSKRLNEVEKSFIGVLDIYGFEHFKKNSFEQFCINYANEKLQQEFYKHVFKLEQEEYASEGLQWSYIDYQDNQPCIDMIENKLGILSLLDEECRMPTNSEKNWVSKLNSHFTKDPYKNSYKQSRFSETEFTIKHYALDVTYNAEGFIDKNKDTISEELIDLLNSSKNSFLTDLLSFRANQATSVVSKARNARPRNPTLGAMFKASLIGLMDTINETNAHYIRCVKPNEAKAAWEFDSNMVLSQLRACGVLETIRISCAGFPSRWTFKDFTERYYMLVKSTNWTKETNKLCQLLLDETVEPEKYQIGTSKIFFRSGVVPYLDRLRNEKMRACAYTLYSVFATNYYRISFIKIIRGIKGLQSVVRGYLARQRVEQERLNKCATVIQSAWKTYVAKQSFRRSRSSIILVQSLVRRSIIRRSLQHKKLSDAAVVLQSWWKTILEKRHYQSLRYYTIRIQSLWRTKLAKRQLVQLRIESKQANHYKEVSYKLENKVFELTQALESERQENKVLVDRVSELEAVLASYAETKLTQDRELRETQLMLEDHSEKDSYLKMLEEKEQELARVYNSVQSLKEANDDLVRMNESLKLQKQQNDNVLKKQSLKLQQKQEIITSLSQATRVLNTMSSIEASHSRDSIGSSRESLMMDARTRRELNNLLFGDRLQIDLDRLYQLPLAKYNTLNKNVESLAQNTLFLSHMTFLVLLQMWKADVPMDSLKVVERTLEHIPSSIAIHHGPNGEPLYAFWVTNLYNLVALINSRIQLITEHGSDEFPEESGEQMRKAAQEYTKCLSNVYAAWIDSINATIKPMVVSAVLENGTDLPARGTVLPKITPANGLRRLFTKTTTQRQTAKYMKDVIRVLDEVYRQCQMFSVSNELYVGIVKNVYRCLNIVAFNSLYLDVKGSWKIGANMSYNYSILKEWCLQHGAAEAVVQLEEMFEVSKLLQTRKDKEDFMNEQVNLCWALSLYQIHWILTHYHYSEYEGMCTSTYLSNLSKRAVQEDDSKNSFVIKYTLIPFESPSTLPQPPAFGQITLPEGSELFTLKRFADLVNVEESFQQAMISIRLANEADEKISDIPLEIEDGQKEKEEPVKNHTGQVSRLEPENVRPAESQSKRLEAQIEAIMKGTVLPGST
ncbi:myosin-52 [Schizosaccharomyces japonicus yFS275]|uniref:Myosin-52 n=1 Tax=Schizosaccharomyces japonicus (strain yFS275 / FY16936) TaxID=402676 RepID=B6K329_SCHJY|nr:myosin-52 [Schizosaccharomyces japonicus yFS275]EEB07886.2 myosin-52 [Schizosaccharomyces japonicus yFS275]